MKYSVQIKYTNPAHEHVSLRRRVDTVTRLVEANSEQEAINRAANQQRSLGFMVREVNVLREAEQIDEQSSAEIKAKYYHGQFDKVKPVEAYDKEGKLVGRYRSMGHAKQMKPGHTYKVEEEVKGNHRPGWMLRDDPELAKKIKERKERQKKREAAYGNPSAGKSVKEELLPKQREIQRSLVSSELAQNKKTNSTEYGRRVAAAVRAARRKVNTQPIIDTGKGKDA